MKPTELHRWIQAEPYDMRHRRVMDTLGISRSSLSRARTGTGHMPARWIIELHKAYRHTGLSLRGLMAMGTKSVRGLLKMADSHGMTDDEILEHIQLFARAPHALHIKS